MSLNCHSDLGMCWNCVRDLGGQEGSHLQGVRKHLFVKEQGTWDTPENMMLGRIGSANLSEAEENKDGKTWPLIWFDSEARGTGFSLGWEAKCQSHWLHCHQIQIFTVYQTSFLLYSVFLASSSFDFSFSVSKALRSSCWLTGEFRLLCKLHLCFPVVKDREDALRINLTACSLCFICT